MNMNQDEKDFDAKAEAARAEANAKAEAAREEFNAKAEAAREEFNAKAEAMRAEAIRAEFNAKAEAAREEFNAKAEAARAEAARAEFNAKAEAAREEFNAKAEAERIEAARIEASRNVESDPAINEKAQKPLSDENRRIAKPEQELRGVALNDPRAPGYGGQAIPLNLDTLRFTNPAEYLKQQRFGFEEKAWELKRAAKYFEQHPAPRPETDAGKAWQDERWRNNPVDMTAWNLGAASVTVGWGENSPNALVRAEHKMRLEVDPIYRNGYESAKRWEMERKAELAKSAGNDLSNQKTPMFKSFVNEAKNLNAEDFAKLENAVSKSSIKLSDDLIAQHKEKMVTDPEYRDTYSKTATSLNAERQANTATNKQKQAEVESQTEPTRTRGRENDNDNGLSFGVGIGIG